MGQINIQTILTSLMTFVKGSSSEILISMILIFSVGHLLSRSANAFVHEDRRRFKLKKSVRYGTSMVAFFWMILLYSNHTKDGDSFPIFIVGVFLAGIAFSMRDIFSNVVGWMVVASHNGYQSGDRIEIGDMRGDVIDIGVLRTTLTEIGEWDDRGEQSTGRMVSFPNSAILTQSVANYNRGFETMWNEITVMVTFESDWKRAEEIVKELATIEYEKNKDRYLVMMQRLKRDFMVTYNYLSPAVYVTIEESGVQLTLRHMVEVRRRRIVNDSLNRQILDAFNSESSINFAYPTTRFYRSGGE